MVLENTKWGKIGCYSVLQCLLAFPIVAVDFIL